MTQPDHFYESLNGTLWRDPAQPALMLSLSSLTPPAHAEIIQQGALILRYGLELLSMRGQFIPAYFESENGHIKTGRAAWEFIWAKFQLYPRAEVIGWGSDGADLHILMRDLDFGEGVQVLVYSDPQARTPLGKLGGVIAPNEAELPPILSAYAPHLIQHG